MNWFKNLKVGHKLLAAFGLVVLAMVCTMLLSNQQAAKERNAIESMYTKGVKESGALARVEAGLYNYDAAVLALLNKGFSGSEIGAGEFDSLNTIRQDYWTELEAFGKAAKDAESQRAYADVSESVKAFDAKQDALVSAIRGGNYQKASSLASETHTFFKGDVVPTIEGGIETLTTMSESYHDGAEAAAAASLTLSIVGTVLTVCLAIGLAMLVSKAIVVPINALKSQLNSLGCNCISGLAASIKALQAGDLCNPVTPVTKTIDYQSKDEIGQIVEIFNTTLTTAQGALLGYNDCLVTLRDVMGQVDHQAATVTQMSQALSSAARDSDEAAESVSRSMDEVGQSVGESSRTSEQIAQSAQKLAEDAQNAAEEMSALFAAIETVLEGSKAQAVATDNASSTATVGGEAVSKTIASMSSIEARVTASSEVVQDLGEKQAQISNIVQTIDDIAAQTNLLALNAAIEAARAGEHGKGFAVVAEEVRKLAERCGDATKEISSLINVVSEGVQNAIETMEQSVREVQEGTGFSGEARTALEEIVAAVAEVKEIAARNDSMVNSMSENATRVQDTVSNVAAITEETAAGAEELSATGQEMNASTEEVGHSIRRQRESINEISQMAGESEGAAQELAKLVAMFKYQKDGEGSAPAVDASMKEAA